MSNKPFRVGCMGAGRVFNEAHLPAYISLDSVELAAIYDTDRKRAESTREHYENDHNFLRVVSRTFGERIIHVEDELSEAGSFRAEIDNFVKSIRADVPSILNAEVAAGGICMINSAHLSELRGRVAITPDELMKFSEEQAADASNVWEGGDRIIRALYASFRVSK